MRARKQRIQLLLLAMPLLLLVFAFSYVPIYGWIYAFYDYRPGIPLTKSAFVGLKYFKEALHEGSQLGNVLQNTLVLSVLSLLMSVIPVLFAILLSEIKNQTFKRIVQTVTTIPNFISWVIVYSICFIFLSVNDGVVNNALLSLHIINKPFDLLGNESAAWYFQTGIGLWKGLGFGAIIYLAAIAGIDQEMYDAAKVDGANRFQLIRHVTIPGILPTYFVLFLLGVSNILNSGLEQYFVFMNPLVQNKLEVLDYYVYNMGLVSTYYSYGIALGIFKSLFGLLMLALVIVVSKRIRGQSIL